MATLMVLVASAARAEGCEDCHRAEAQEFSRTIMARAATTPDFRREWSDNGKPRACLDCHAPDGGDGIGCRDCHGEGGHPYSPIAVPEACARCHDAPGESTLRHFRVSHAAAQGRTCLDCHLAKDAGRHAFQGPSDPAFLAGIADVRLTARREDGIRRFSVAIRHAAGHALPGGTTGRSVWLVVTGRDPTNAIRWRETTRFGWVLTGSGRWEDRTLRGGKGVTVDIADPGDATVAEVEAILVFRFAPGPLSVEDPRQVELSRATMTLR